MTRRHERASMFLSHVCCPQESPSKADHFTPTWSRVGRSRRKTLRFLSRTPGGATQTSCQKLPSSHTTRTPSLDGRSKFVAPA